MTVVGVNPQMLTLARRSRGLTQEQLAQMAGVGTPALSRYEAGIAEVSADKLFRLAAALDYRAEFFYRTPTLFGVGGGAVFHRKLQSLPTKKLYQAHACAEVRRLEIATMLTSLGVTPPALPDYSVELFDDDPAKIARSVRVAMDIPPGPVFNLTETLERNWCIVVAHNFGARHLDGFSQRPQYPPSLVHLNEELPPDRWRWTLAHELGHLVMHSDLSEAPRVVENQANLFAAEFLTPAHEIAPMLDGLTFQKLAGLKLEWKVSMQALITRAYQLEAISNRQRQSMFARLAQSGYRTREPATLDPPVEKPSWMMHLARRHYNELQYSHEELAQLLNINDADFAKHYTGDVWASIGDILQDF